MQEKHLYEYATLRVVPSVEKEEFINVGLILFCKRKKLVLCRYIINKPRLLCLFPNVDVEVVENNLKTLQTLAEGTAGSPIGRLDAPDRFRWLTATRSTIIQTGKVHPGICQNPEAHFEELFNKLITV